MIDHQATLRSDYMILSNDFVEVLKNFSTINSGLVVKPGSTLRTISSNKTVLAEAHVDEVFEREFGIYDLNKTLGLLSLNKDKNEVAIEPEQLVFPGLKGRGKVNQRFTDPKLIMTPPAKNINVPAYDVKFDLDADVFDWLLEVSSILKCPNIAVQSSGGDITINAVDVKDEVVDSAEYPVNGTSATPFKAVFKIDNIKAQPGAYTVEISKLGVSKFTHKTKKLTYWIAVEAGSTTWK